MYQKYKNNKVEVDNIKFDSKMESNVYSVIKERGIKCVLQPKYLLQDKFRHPITNKIVREINYIGDFDITIDDELYTIDVKGMETQVFKIKAKMFLKKYGREIIRIKSVKHFKEWLELNNKENKYKYGEH